MNDRIIRQSYDRGYDAGHGDRGKPAAECASNPYRPPISARGYGRYHYWDMGYEDGFRGRERKITQGEADARAYKRLAELGTIRPAILTFALALERMLAENDDKPPWIGASLDTLMTGFIEEIDELGYELSESRSGRSTNDAVRGECLDVALSSMFLWFLHGGHAQVGVAVDGRGRAISDTEERGEARAASTDSAAGPVTEP